MAHGPWPMEIDGLPIKKWVDFPWLTVNVRTRWPDPIPYIHIFWNIIQIIPYDLYVMENS